MRFLKPCAVEYSLDDIMTLGTVFGEAQAMQKVSTTNWIA